MVFLHPDLSIGDLVLEGGGWEVERTDQSVFAWNNIEMEEDPLG